MRFTKRRKVPIAVAVLVAGGIALAAVAYLPWGSGWPHVPSPKLFVFTQPRPEDVAGVYELTRQTITTNGLAVLEGRPCRLELRPDGSFSVTNYPRWSMYSSSKPRVVEFVSTTGSWSCHPLNIYYRNQRCWGVGFTETNGIDSLALRSKGAPYDLMLTYGDADDGAVMLFGRKK